MSLHTMPLLFQSKQSLANTCLIDYYQIPNSSHLFRNNIISGLRDKMEDLQHIFDK